MKHPEREEAEHGADSTSPPGAVEADPGRPLPLVEADPAALDPREPAESSARSRDSAASIPAVAHFIWLGSELPWFALMAIRSARLRGGFDRIVLHHEGRLRSCTYVDELRRCDDVELRALDEKVLFEKLEAEGGPSLEEAYRRLEAPASRADVLRLLILALEGGVYLDADTLTLRDFGALRARASAFVGTEWILHPGPDAAADLQPGPVQRRLLGALRTILSRIGPGWRAAIRLQRFYPGAANNAVLGATPGHPFVHSLLARIRAMPARRQRVRFALGPHLIQAAIAAGDDHGAQILRPAVLFPLGPVVATHWFRTRRRMPRVSAIIEPDTTVIHWYASSSRLRDVLRRCDDAYIRAHRDRQLYSRIACAILDGRLGGELDD